MSRCICPETGLGHPECPSHGLKPGQAYIVMDRHAKPGEDARMAQHRLYRESQGLPPERECRICGRVGRPWSFVRVRGYGDVGFKCRARKACSGRLNRRGLTEEQRRGKAPIG